jgi:hypothetical protein
MIWVLGGNVCASPSASIADVQSAIAADVQKKYGVAAGQTVIPAFVVL